MDDCIETLTELGKDSLKLNHVVVQPFGGRVMGLYPREGVNALWTHPALDTITSARALLTGGGWINLGGDRTWVSPEFDLFVSDASRPWETYRVPAGIDPADYHVVSRSANAVELETVAVVDFLRSGYRSKMSLRKRIEELATPGFTLPEGVSAAGYELTCTLSAADPLPPPVRPAVWNLLQVPGGGEIIVPVKGPAAPIAFFGKQRWRQDGQHLIASVPVTPEGYKFGVMADHCRGLMLYLNETAPQPFLIFRRFNVGSQDQYFDTPFNDPQKKALSSRSMWTTALSAVSENWNIILRRSYPASVPR